mmetsp:Transcript_15373/g.36471  ORF Transcript_15373/g.36471 Transcript_15373/m.36471 type:complete len:203 (+) Transcript_15373:3411-4019(+)
MVVVGASFDPSGKTRTLGAVPFSIVKEDCAHALGRQMDGKNLSMVWVEAGRNISDSATALRRSFGAIVKDAVLRIDTGVGHGNDLTLSRNPLVPNRGARPSLPPSLHRLIGVVVLQLAFSVPDHTIHQVLCSNPLRNFTKVVLRGMHIDYIGSFDDCPQATVVQFQRSLPLWGHLDCIIVRSACHQSNTDLDLLGLISVRLR